MKVIEGGVTAPKGYEAAAVAAATRSTAITSRSASVSNKIRNR